MTEKNNCKIKECFANMDCGLKLAYILILILFICNIFIFLKISKNCTKGQDNNFKKYIDDNPKVILDSVQRYVEREQAEAQRQQQQRVEENIKKNLTRIRDEKNTGVANPDGKKIIVEFYDYNCGYCKMASKVVDKIANEDKNVKVIFRDFPIFGGTSLDAAKYSIAVAMTAPSKFLAFHNALMNGNAKTIDGIEEALKEAKISVERIRRTLKSNATDIEKRINDNRQLGNEIGLNGTPAFLVGEEFVPGYIDENTMKEKLK